MSRKKSREVLFKMVFSLCFHAPERVDEDIFLIDELDETNKKYVLDNFAGIQREFDALSDIISKNLEDYTIDRLFKVDLAILILATYELMYTKDTPTSVVINEAVELAKKYSTDKSFSFINGVSSKISKNIG